MTALGWLAPHVAWSDINKPALCIGAALVIFIAILMLLPQSSSAPSHEPQPVPEREDDL